jgi:leucyl/phenylalanyl-tRNA--protein transferase
MEHSPYLSLFLDPSNPVEDFPKLENALQDPNGLIGIGGCLSTSRLLNAYYNGIFPWFEEDANPSESQKTSPILWWSPDPRCILDPILPKINRSLKKSIRNKPYRITVDHCFEQVIKACATPQQKRPETWITAAMVDAYCALHHQGHAHSVECWNGDELIGGLYGLAIGQVFCGESMFSRQSDASKVSFMMLSYALCEAGFQMIDGQLPNDYLLSLGGLVVSRDEFYNALYTLRDQTPAYDVWQDQYFQLDLLRHALS